ncbi:ATP-binding cassette domain-containing protein [Streptomyces sp. NRRL B-1677]|uniref:ATP-binding cassette domain-containing protein n=1 Tax=Streptomyces sp. NRRL B-1677 TaxID=2682966 RepID=UPI001892B49D|nr:ATP-binding cassette domain-containing protein [Streptomyces sp. NRRL B-1677]MBF6047088.1 ATP-binding cassette domain-containing protein [Streptomyces sp. NRRL B-1677]
MVIEAEKMSRKFRQRGTTVEAVRGIDLHVRKGEIFGFLGPNGAGKTTTVRMLATLLAPDSGQVSVAGCALPKETRRARHLIGYVGQAGGTDDGMPILDNLVLQARLNGLGRTAAHEQSRRTLAALGLVDLADRLPRSLSGGQRRRVALALGLVHQPQVLFLDEPTLGLDPAARAVLWEQIRALREAGTTVFLTTHYLEEADALCDRVAIIHQGRIVASGGPAELKRGISGDAVTLSVGERDGERVMAALEHLPFVREVREAPAGVRVYVENGADAIPSLVRGLDELGVTVQSIGLESASLDDVFLKHTGSSLRMPGAAGAESGAETSSSYAA